jgi:glycosyltransferase involved in cell wall biosynthesis/GT2 family glycosyltransferase
MGSGGERPDVSPSSTDAGDTADVEFRLAAEHARVEILHRRWMAERQRADRETLERHRWQVAAADAERRLDALTHSTSWRVGSSLVQAGARSKALARHLRSRPAPVDTPAVAAPPETRPLVSVIMPVFDKGSCVRDAVASVRAQTLTSWELIVWDDGSTDPATVDALDSLGGPGIVVIRASNQGVIGARNAAIERSRGRYVCCLDPDDVLQPTYLEKAVVFLEQHPEAGFAYPWVRSTGDSDELWETSDLHPRVILRENQVPICAVVRREVLDATGGFSTVMTRSCEDWELWAHAAELGIRGLAMPEVLFRYSYSDRDGRDAQSRHLRTEVNLDIVKLHPGLATADPWAAGTRSYPVDLLRVLEGEAWLLPPGSGRPVVVFAPWFVGVGGAEQVVRDLVAGLVAAGRTVVAVSTADPPAGSSDGTEALMALTPFVYNLPRFCGPDTYATFVRSLMERLAHPAVVLMGSTWAYEHLAGIRTWARGRTRVVDLLFNHLGHLTDSLAAGALIDVRVTASRRLERLLVDHFAVAEPVRTIYVGIREPTVSSTGPIDPPWRRRDLPLVGWLGRWSPEKRPEWFARAASRLGHRADFVMTGEGPCRADLEDWAGRAPALHLLGPVTHAGDVLAALDVLCVTSEVEGIPLVAMEAAALGVPVVTTDVGGLREVVRDGVNGRLVPAGDPDRFVEELEAILVEPGHLARLQSGAAALGLAPEMTVEAMVAAWNDVLDPESSAP